MVGVLEAYENGVVSVRIDNDVRRIPLESIEKARTYFEW